MMKSKQLDIVLRERKRVLFKGAAKSLSSVNNLGKFDILYNHANFVTTVKEMIILTHNRGYERKFKIGSGILSAEENKVEVFVGV
ncbi:MAG: hypothetical protein U9Q63_04455 [Patescibacteria group bacterium]|nr:hypothetical protein [Patescibacteria group bacterium]